MSIQFVTVTSVNTVHAKPENQKKKIKKEA